jgi:hypothetical protein
MPIMKKRGQQTAPSVREALRIATETVVQVATKALTW